MLDTELSMKQRITRIAYDCFYHLRPLYRPTQQIRVQTRRRQDVTSLLGRVQQWSDPRFSSMFVDRSTVGQHSASGAIHGSWIGF